MSRSKTCIAILSLGAPALWLFGCSAAVPTRLPAMPCLVRTGELQTGEGFSRNDPRLGLDRDPVVRATVRSTEQTFDRQRVIDGRPYSDYRVTTRNVESLRR